jgi:hypothetical protein
MPEPAASTVALICVFGEFPQYCGLYDRYYDPYDFIAYASRLLPCTFIDRWLLTRRSTYWGQSVQVELYSTIGFNGSGQTALPL